jgi:dsDNA-binding SOS-regulon protein
MNIYLVYAIRKLANVIELLEDSSQKEEMSKWMAEINDTLQWYFGKKEAMDYVVKEIDTDQGAHRP